MKPYRNSKAFQARTGGGQFRRWDLDRDFGVRECPWCHHLSATRPESIVDDHGFIDPAEFTRRVCSRCGWDSARGSVGRADAIAAKQRFARADIEYLLSARALAQGDIDETDRDILEWQQQREARIFNAMFWLLD